MPWGSRFREKTLPTPAHPRVSVPAPGPAWLAAQGISSQLEALTPDPPSQQHPLVGWLVGFLVYCQKQ